MYDFKVVDHYTTTYFSMNKQYVEGAQKWRKKTNLKGKSKIAKTPW